MNKLTEYILKRIITSEVKQGCLQDKCISKLYSLIREAVEKEYREDTEYMLDMYYEELFSKSLHTKKTYLTYGDYDSFHQKIDHTTKEFITKLKEIAKKHSYENSNAFMCGFIEAIIYIKSIIRNQKNLLP